MKYTINKPITIEDINTILDNFLSNGNGEVSVEIEDRNGLVLKFFSSETGYYSEYFVQYEYEEEFGEVVSESGEFEWKECISAWKYLAEYILSEI